MWNVAVGIFSVALFVGLYVWACPLPELKKTEGSAVRGQDHELDPPAD